MEHTAQQEQQCLGCRYNTPTHGPRICPLCGHVFQGKGWDGIDAHWRAKHENILRYEAFWASLCDAHRVNKWHVIGIDPAPTKPAIVFDGDDFHSIKPLEIREYIIEAAQKWSSLLIAWDAPLSFDITDFYDRRVDKAVRKWIKTQEANRHFSEKAINVRAFAGLSHWAISCFTLGLPFGQPPRGLALLSGVPTKEQIGLFAIEVHPAVAMGAKWISRQFSDPFPRYKGNPTACAEIAERLCFPKDAGKNDDTLDAYAAYWLGQLFLSGEASWLGNPATGGYVMPDCVGEGEEKRGLRQEAWRRGMGIDKGVDR